MQHSTFLPRRCAQYNPINRFNKNNYSIEHPEGTDVWEQEKKKTKFYEEQPKTIVNKITSKDIPLAYSLNPYQGCEHGCVYCYARNTHEYYGHSAGTDFEQKIIIKKNASKRLEELFQSKNWKGEPIALSGNTDCYQPAERKQKITRALLKLCLKYQNPVGIITKNKLILRDLDIITELSKNNLVNVFISITSTDEKLRAKLEPRTSTYASRFEIVKKLAEANVPVGVMNAPIIPGLNDQSLYEVLRQAKLHGAQYAGYTMVRLNGAVGDVFTHWIEQAYPLKASKVLSQISGVHNNKLNDSRIGIRMKGQGAVADIVNQQFKKYCKQFGLNKDQFKFNTSAFIRRGQLRLF